MGDKKDNWDAKAEIVIVNSDYDQFFNINTLDTLSQHAGNRIDTHHHTSRPLVNKSCIDSVGANIKNYINSMVRINKKDRDLEKVMIHSDGCPSQYNGIPEPGNRIDTHQHT